MCRAWAADTEPRVVQLAVRNLSRMKETDTAAILAVAGSIWTPYGIRVETGVGPGAITVVLNPGRLTSDHDFPSTLGTTLFGPDHALPFITLSLAATEALAADADANIGVIPFRALSREQQSAIVTRMLGVALAHELGHYLLDTKRHSSAGLLRAALRTRELAFPVLARLTLTSAQQRLLCRDTDAATQQR